MDESFIQLLELVRAGWSFQLSPEPVADSMLAARGVVIWSRQRSELEETLDGPVSAVPIVQWVSAFSPTEMRQAIAKMHARVFPVSPDGLDWAGELPEIDL